MLGEQVKDAIVLTAFYVFACLMVSGILGIFFVAGWWGLVIGPIFIFVFSYLAIRLMDWGNL